MDVEGKSLQEASEASPHLSILELVTKRISSLELAGEIWLQKYSLPVVDALSDEASLRQIMVIAYGERILIRA